MKTNAVLFPGQGVQGENMLQGISEEDISELVGDAKRVLGFDIAKLCKEGSSDILKITCFTQTSIFFVCCLKWLRYLREVLGGDASNLVVAGLSLGEYIALTAAKVWPFETGMWAVWIRGLLMETAGSLNRGGMVTLTSREDLTDDMAHALAAETGTFAANFITYSQVSFSGDNEAIARLRERAKKKGFRVKDLEVSAAFHSRFMQSAGEGLEGAFKNLSLSEPKITTIFNAIAVPETKPEKIKELLKMQIDHPVLWRHSIVWMLHQGIRVFTEITPFPSKPICLNMVKSIAAHEGIKENELTLAAI